MTAPVAPVALHRIRKACPVCGQAFEGNSFLPQAPGDPPRSERCAACLDRIEADFEARQAAMVRPVEATPVLTPPRRPPEDDEW
jgi:hypothetical protein